jgi:hypothetical protein
MGIEPTSEAWEARNITQNTLDWRQFRSFRNTPIGKSKRPIPNLDAASFVGKHSVAFLLPDQGAPGGVCLRASGSLVTFDQRYFVLTATHVWARPRKSPIIHCSAIAEISHDFSPAIVAHVHAAGRRRTRQAARRSSPSLPCNFEEVPEAVEFGVAEGLFVGESSH